MPAHLSNENLVRMATKYIGNTATQLQKKGNFRLFQNGRTFSLISHSVQKRISLPTQTPHMDIHRHSTVIEHIGSTTRCRRSLRREMADGLDLGCQRSELLQTQVCMVVSRRKASKTEVGRCEEIGTLSVNDVYLHILNKCQ